MKINLLTPAQASWLADTIARNRAAYGGMSMKLDDDSGDPPNDPDPKPDDRGFPSDTPVKDMTAEQQAAYYKHQSTRHEERNKELLRITGGKYGDALKAELDALESLRDKDRTDTERATEQARQEGRTTARTELSASAARAAFEFALGHDPETNDQSALIDTLDLSKVLSDDGTVDTAKVRAVVKQIAPADKGTGKQKDPDYGGGRRHSEAGTGVSSGRDLFEARRKKSTSK